MTSPAFTDSSRTMVRSHFGQETLYASPAVHEPPCSFSRRECPAQVEFLGRLGDFPQSRREFRLGDDCNPVHSFLHYIQISGFWETLTQMDASEKRHLALLKKKYKVPLSPQQRLDQETWRELVYYVIPFLVIWFLFAASFVADNFLAF